MQPDVDLSDLPEAIPLRRVSPFWRIFSLLMLILLAALTALVFIMGIAIVQQRNRNATAANVFVPAPMWAPPAVVGDTEEQVDPQSLSYPVKDDLRQFCSPLPGTSAAEKPTARDRFLALSKEVWRATRYQSPTTLVVSPDGTQLAFPSGDHLVAGLFANSVEITETRKGPVTLAPGGGPPASIRLQGVPAWLPDNNRLLIGRENGQVRRYDLKLNAFDVLSLHGGFPALWSDNAEQLLLVRGKSTPKFDAPGVRSGVDPSELVVADLATGNTRVLTEADTSQWGQVSLSPDGQWLAFISDRGQDHRSPARWRLYLVELDGGMPKGEMLPLTPAVAAVGPMCWSPDSKYLVYARHQDPLSPDAWEGELQRAHRALDIFEWDLAANRERRLSRGGGIYSPSIAKDGTLFFLVWQPDKQNRHVRLHAMALTDARDFAEKDRSPTVRDAAGWTMLVERVLKEAPLGEPKTRTPETFAKLAASFAKTYREVFKSQPPATAEEFDREWLALGALRLPTTTRQNLGLVLGAVAGEALRQQGLASWRLGEVNNGSAPEDSLFAYTLDPFLLAVPEVLDASKINDANASLRWPLTAVLEKAEGRPLILSQDGRAAATLTDPELAKGKELLQQGKTAEGVALLVKVAERHPRNQYLAAHIGQLLYDFQCTTVLREYMNRICNQRSFSARKFNLLGLCYLKGSAQMDASPKSAIDAFQNALRCDLQYGPAYLNLAQAHAENGDTQAARQCLRRYLELHPEGEYANDARRRMASFAAGSGP